MKKLLFFMSMLLAACSSLPPASAPVASFAEPDKALVYVYRRAIALGPTMVQIYDGKQLMGALPPGSYLSFYAPPGPRVFKAAVPGTNDSIPYATTLNVGQTYYFLIYLLGDQLIGNVSIAPADSRTANTAMATLKLIENKNSP